MADLDFLKGRTTLDWKIENNQLMAVIPRLARYVVGNLNESTWRCDYRGAPWPRHLISGSLAVCIEAAERFEWQQRVNTESTTTS